MVDEDVKKFFVTDHHGKFLARNNCLINTDDFGESEVQMEFQGESESEGEEEELEARNLFGGI